MDTNCNNGILDLENIGKVDNGKLLIDDPNFEIKGETLIIKGIVTK